MSLKSYNFTNAFTKLFNMELVYMICSNILFFFNFLIPSNTGFMKGFVGSTNFFYKVLEFGPTMLV